MKPGFDKIIVVGAGPSGLLLALLLARKGIKVTILEANSKLDDRPRAAHFGPPAIPELRRAGILEEVREKGMTLNTMCWRRLEDYSLISGFDAGVLESVDGDIRTACLPLQDLDAIMLEHFVKMGGEVKWLHKVKDVGQDKDKAWVDVETPKGDSRVEADYVVGCDGATSAVRRCLFGDSFPGYTWEQQIVATNTYYDFRKFGFHDANFIIHPEHHFMAAIIQPDGLWRVTYGETPGLTHEELVARQPWKFETILPGHPKPHEYELVSISPYRMHQRIADKFRVGRILLAADAAHLCNPFGGLGITGGFVDVGGLYDCLAGIYDNLVSSPDAILDLYSTIRREKYESVINPTSTENFKRVHDDHPETRLERDEFMKLCKEASGDEERMRGILMGMMEVRYDFTKHYDMKPGQNGVSTGGEKGAVGVEAVEIAPTAAN